MRFIKLLIILPLAAFTSLNSPDAKKYYQKGVESLNSKEYVEAIGMFTNAISLKPDYADAYYYRGYAKDLLGKAMQFKNIEMCTDYVMAMKHGHPKAVSKLEKGCMGECNPIDAALSTPDMAYCINISNKNLAAVPAETDKLKYAVRIDLSENNLSTVGSDLTSINSLLSLDLSNNNLTTLPESFTNLEYLRELDLSSNKLKGLPSGFGKMENLKTLNLRKNGLETMPRSISNLTSLEILDLSFNKIKSIPLEIANMKSLKRLNLMGTDVPAPEKAKLKALLPGVDISFDEY